MHIPLVYEHLFYKYFVRRSVGQATKGKRASLLMDVVILVKLFLVYDYVMILYKNFNFFFLRHIFLFLSYQSTRYNNVVEVNQVEHKSISLLCDLKRVYVNKFQI